MEKTLIMSLENHHIYYVTDEKSALYIAVPYKKFPSSNISIELRDDTAELVFNKSNIQGLVEKLKSIYAKIDNYNISLIIPVINGTFLANLRTSNDLKMFESLDKALAKVINNSYITLTQENVKVEKEIIMINNEKYKVFMNWFTQKYGSRCQYKTLIEMMPVSVEENLNKVELSGINFVVGKEQQEPVNTQENNVSKYELDNTLILNEIELPEDENLPIRKEAHQAGYISYYLLGVISIAVSLVILYMLL